MLQWIVDNKQWLFSGIGVTLVLGVFYVVRKLLSRKRNAPPQTESTPPPPEQVPVTAARPVAKLDLAKIRHDIESRPPYQRKQAIQNYIGLRFEFTGQLFSAEAKDEGKIQFCLHKSSGKYPLVIGVVIEKEYPELKVMHQGTKMTVQGNMADFDSFVVTIDNVVITNYASE